MKDRRVEIYVDYEFLEKYFEHLNTADVLSEEFEVYYSFFKVIRQDHVRLISLETGKHISGFDIIRVYQPDLIRKGLINELKIADKSTYHFNIAYPFAELQNPQSLFFGEVFYASSEILGKKHGFVFSCNSNFIVNWSRLLLINIKSTIHVKSGFSWSDLTPYSLPSNSILFIDPYLISWLKRAHCIFDSQIGRWKVVKSKIEDNLIEALKAITNSSSLQCTSLNIITKSDYKKTGDQGESKANIQALFNKIKHIISVSIASFENGALTERKGSGDEYDIASKHLQNNLHDRYIITNYHLIISTHSLDFIDREEGKQITKKNTQLIIQPLLQADYFKFYTSKLEDYAKIINWKESELLTQFLISESDGVAANKHFNRTAAI